MNRIRILISKLDETVPRFHNTLKMRKIGGGCLCGQCTGKGGGGKYTVKGKTYRQKIEASLKGKQYIMRKEGAYGIYEWEEDLPD